MSAASTLAHFDDLFWKQLLGYIEAGLVVPIVGEELLRLRLEGREVSLYTLLAERLAPALGVSAEGLPSTGALHEVACRYLDAHGDLEGIYPILQEVMPGRGEIPIPDPLLQLAGIRPFRLFVTTTFDPLLSWALDQVRFGGREKKTECLAYSPEDPQDLPCEVEALTEPLVYHLFGKLSAAPEYAVTEEDMIEFLRALQMENRRPSRLFDALNKKHLLFLGGSFPDWPARFFLRLAKRERLKLSRSKTDVMADTRAQTDPGLVLFLQRFSTSTKVFQGGGAAEFVAEMARRWQERAPKPPEAPSTSIPGLPAGMREGAIFLSYASEDRQAALDLKEALDHAGLDSWIDVDPDRLQPGSPWEEEIHSAIDHSSVFVPLLSQHVLTPKRRYFRTEWDYAEKLAAQAPPATSFIVPVALDDISRTSPLLPEALRKAQWTSLADGQPPPPVLVDTLKQLYRNYQKSLGATP